MYHMKKRAVSSEDVVNWLSGMDSERKLFFLILQYIRGSCDYRLFYQIKSSHRIVVIGGGATGTELAVEIAVQFPEKEVTLIHRGQNLISNDFTERFQNKLKAILDRYYIKYKLGETTKVRCR